MPPCVHCTPELALHLIVDNSSTHTTEAIRDFLTTHPRFDLHFMPTSASWLNAFETWFGQLELRALRRSVFTSLAELRDEIRRFIEAHNLHSAKPFRWTKSGSAIPPCCRTGSRGIPSSKLPHGTLACYSSRNAGMFPIVVSVPTSTYRRPLPNISDMPIVASNRPFAGRWNFSSETTPLFGSG